MALIEKKLETFSRRTAPLVDHYEERGVPVTRLDVSADTQAQDLMGVLEAAR